MQLELDETHRECSGKVVLAKSIISVNFCEKKEHKSNGRTPEPETKLELNDVVSAEGVHEHLSVVN